MFKPDASLISSARKNHKNVPKNRLPFQELLIFIFLVQEANSVGTLYMKIVSERTPVRGGLGFEVEHFLHD